MNINNKGAKDIYYQGAAITAGVIQAGDVATFIYDGTRYRLLTVDSKSHLLAPSYSVPSGSENTQYGKLFTITPETTGHYDLIYVFDVTDRSNKVTTVEVYCSTSSNEKYINKATVQYEGSLGSNITAYRFKDETNKVERLEIWGKITGWNPLKIYPKTQSITSGIAVTWNGTKADALPTNATTVVDVTAKTWLGTAATALNVSNTGNTTISASKSIYLNRGASQELIIKNGTTTQAKFDSEGNFIPGANNVYDLGSSANGWNSIYANNLESTNVSGLKIKSGSTLNVVRKASTSLIF